MSTAGAPAILDAFGAIAHPVRRHIVTKLVGGPKPVRDLAIDLPISRPAVSQHLRLLLEVGVVSKERSGRENRYRLHPERLDEVRTWLAQLDASWGSALGRLREHLEQDR
jgi:DNA-binding transcriptional ArsR family regulator